MNKSYKFRIYPTKQQEMLMQKTFGCCRFVYNYYLAKRIEAYQKDKSIMNYYDCSKDLTLLKKELPWLKEIDSRALIFSIRNLDNAYQNFFRRIKEGNSKVGFPRFKSKKTSKKSYKTSFSIKINENTIQIPKVGEIKCSISKQIEGRILSITISQNPSGKYFASVNCCEVSIKPFSPTNTITGIRLGIKNIVTTSEGKTIENPYFLLKNKKIAKLHRQLSRKQKDSSNRNKARKKLAKLYEKISNQRNDFLHKQSTQIIKTYDTIMIQDLEVKKMQKKTYSKYLTDASLGEFIRQLEYKSNWYGKNLRKVPTDFPSSQLCSNCGMQNKKLKNRAERWTCPECKSEHNKNVNTAKNILKEGLKIKN